MKVSKKRKKVCEKFVLVDWEMWRTDIALRSCSLAARGFWIDALSWMWADNEDNLSATCYEEFSRMMRCFPQNDAEQYIDELVKNGVTHRTISPSGRITIYGGKWYRIVRSRHIPATVKRQVLAVGICCYCGATEELTVDHIKPFSQGGTHDPSNLQCACWPCNLRKRTKSHQEFLGEIRRSA